MAKVVAKAPIKKVAAKVPAKPVKKAVAKVVAKPVKKAVAVKTKPAPKVVANRTEES